MIEHFDTAADASDLGVATGDGLSFECILGAAGTGKSTLLHERAADDPNYARVTASTGIAAVNLGPGVTTVNSALGFYNEESAFEALEHGRLARRFADLAEQGYKNLVIDEVSMMSAGVLTAISLGAAQGAERVQMLNNREGKSLVPCGVILTGDYCQLPPINAPFAFTSPVWPRYDANIVRLDKVYRQTNPAFLEALTHARAGRGTTATMKLSACGVQFVSERDDFFDGTSLVPTNDMANKINATRYAEVAGVEHLYKSSRWGKESGEWKDIQEQLGLKVGVLVMILANEPRTFGYVNGDTGIVVDMDDACVTVEIHRGTHKHVKEIPFVWRENTQKDEPEQAAKYEGVTIDGKRFLLSREIEVAYKAELAALDGVEVGPDEQGQAEVDTDIEGTILGSNPVANTLRGAADKTRARRFAKFFEFYDTYVADAIKRRLPYYSVDKQKWVVGWIEYLPIRLAYASTIHKCLVPDALVSSSSGIKKLKDVSVGDHLWSGVGWATVKAIEHTMRPALRVTTHQGYETVCSPNHRFSVDGSVLIEASDLLDSCVRTGWFLPDTQHDSTEPERLAYLAGILVGDGSYTDKKEGNVHFASCDSEMRTYFEDSVTTLFGIHVGHRSDGRGSFFTSKPVREKLADLGLDYVKADFKSIPWGIVRSKSTACSFLRGLMDTDGSVYPSGVVLCTASKTLSRQFQMLMLSLGITSVRREYPGAKLPYYQIRVGAQSLEDYKRLIGFRRKRKAEKLQRCKPNRIIARLDVHSDRVVRVEDLGLVLPMIDIELSTVDRIFLADGFAMHNSQGLTLDRVQIDARSRFAGNPGMIYVALSRCRTPENIRVVANVGDFSKRIQTAKECLRWV